MKNKIHWLLLGLILALALFLRSYDIGNVPPGIYPDESVNGEDALRAIQQGDWRWFYPANQGREGLFMNLIALCFKYLGASILTLKLPAILFGTLTALGTYLLAQEIFRFIWPDATRKRAALIAAFLVATSFWAINFSRISFRANMLPATLALSTFFLWRGLRTRKRLDFVWGGLLFGLGLHGYIAFRIAPLILIATFCSLLISRPHFIREYWKQILFFLAAALLVASPILYTFYLHPEYLESRSGHVSVFSPSVNKGHPWPTLGRSLGLSLIKYNYVGDMNWRHNYPPYPLLDFFPNIAFLFGFLYSFRKLFRLLRERIRDKKPDPELDVHVFLLSWFFVMLIPEFLTAEGNPHALRSIGTLPAVFLFAALAFGFLFEHFNSRSPVVRKTVTLLIVAALIFSGTFNTLKYFAFWAKKPEVARSFNRNLTLISRHIDTLPDSMAVFVITGYNTLERLPIFIFHSERPLTRYLYPHESGSIRPENDRFEVILTGNYGSAVSDLQSRFPGGTLDERKDDLGSVYYIFRPAK